MKFDWAILSHRAYKIGILIKGLDGLQELAGGGALLLTSRPAIRQAVALLTRQELIEDPHDFVANHLLQCRSSYRWARRTLPASTCWHTGW